MKVKEYFSNFLQEILARSEADNNFSESICVEVMAERMVEAGEIDNLDDCFFKKRGIRVDGYSFVPDESLLNLFVADYRPGASLETLTQTDARKAFSRVEKFFSSALEKKFHQEMEESSPGFSLAHEIFIRKDVFSKVRFYLLSNAEVSERVKAFEVRNIDAFSCSFHVWDITRFHRLDESGKGREDVVIDFHDLIGAGISCLPAHLEGAPYESYLAIMPGDALAKLYDEYGQRLLEQNVRTFLQFRGNVNKGIRNTILNDPGMFFAYNNGITATAEKVVLDERKTTPIIRRVRNLQIVNGGQTTAAIYGARKGRDRASLENIFVQMKLSIIDPERSDEVVPRISEYANSQNRVNAADFFSNHPFHVRIEEFSRRLWAPSREGTQKETHWYYERARGQFGNEQVNLTPASKKKFLLQNPRAQMFTKTDLAKFQNTWDEKPHTVSTGAQKNFAKFASDIGRNWEKDDKRFNELYFKELVAKAILFRHTERLVMQQDWYAGGYRANIVTYTLSLLAKLIREGGAALDFHRIWKEQAPGLELEKQITDLARRVNDIIQDTPGNITNVTEWCKKEACWTGVSGAQIHLRKSFLCDLKDGVDVAYEEKEARKVQVIDDGIEAQSRVLTLVSSGTWQALREWNTSMKVLGGKQLGCIDAAARSGQRLPTEKQSIIALQALATAVEEGFPMPV